MKFIDFHSLIQDKKKEYSENYDDVTTSFYKEIRENKIDPICQEYINDEYQFKYYCIWDPITGVSNNIQDPIGPLCFNAVSLFYYFYSRRLCHLWNNEKDDGEYGGFYEGYYGIGLGKGKECYIESRGSFPEYYLWRLPINDCYIIKGTDLCIPLKGPELNREDICKINNIVHRTPANMWINYFSSLPDLVKIFDLYQQAIDDNPNLKYLFTHVDYINNNNNVYEDPKFYHNACAVDKLRRM